jgi:hypothetical protein
MSCAVMMMLVGVFVGVMFIAMMMMFRLVFIMVTVHGTVIMDMVTRRHLRLILIIQFDFHI